MRALMGEHVRTVWTRRGGDDAERCGWCGRKRRIEAEPDGRVADENLFPTEPWEKRRRWGCDAADPRRAWPLLYLDADRGQETRRRGT